MKTKLIGLVVLAVLALGLAAFALNRNMAQPPAVSEKVAAAYSREPSAPASSKPMPTVAFLGDSFTHGDGATAPQYGWTVLLSEKRGWNERNFGFGGTGYATAGALPGGQPYIDRVDGIIAAEPEIVIVAGGGNDRGTDERSVAAGVNDTLTRIRTGLPTAKIIVIAPWVLKAGDEGATARVAAIVEAEAKAVRATYVTVPNPVLTRPALKTSDGVHPNDEGHAAIAEAVNKALPKL